MRTPILQPTMNRLSLLLFCLLVWNCPPARAADAAHNFARWEKEISAYEQMDHTNPPPKDAWLFIGSSTVRLWRSLAADFPGQRVINRGFGGSEIMDSTYFAERIIFPYHPSKVF